MSFFAYDEGEIVADFGRIRNDAAEQRLMTNKIAILFLSLLIFSCGPRRDDARVTLIDPPAGGDFKITSTKGEFDSKLERGKVLFIFFGFTRCPYICPKTLGNLSRMMKTLSPAEKEKVKVLFVSVDNERDSFPILKERVEYYGDKFIGATADDHDLEELISKFGGRYSRRKNKFGDVLVEHSDEIYIVNTKGEFVNKLPYDDEPEKLKAAYLSADTLKPLRETQRLPRHLEVLAKNEKCDLAKTPCDIKIADKTYTMDFWPRPITTNRTINITLKTDGELVPFKIDFEGKELQMGYLRSDFSSKSKGEFESQIVLPICEINKMTWFARVVIKAKEKMSLLEYRFTTLQ